MHFLRCVPKSLDLQAVFGPAAGQRQKKIPAGTTTLPWGTRRDTGLLVVSIAPVLVTTRIQGATATTPSASDDDDHTHACPAGHTVVIFDRDCGQLTIVNASDAWISNVSIDALREEPEE